MTETTFMDKCLSGAASADSIDKYVEEWHTSYTAAHLHAFLGMTEGEYELWLKNPDSLKLILQSRRRRAGAA